MGWYACNLFLEGKLNTEPINTRLFIGVDPVPPIDFKKTRKVPTKLQFRISYGVPEQKEEEEENLGQS